VIVIIAVVSVFFFFSFSRVTEPRYKGLDDDSDVDAEPDLAQVPGPSSRENGEYEDRINTASDPRKVGVNANGKPFTDVSATSHGSSPSPSSHHPFRFIFFCFCAIVPIPILLCSSLFRFHSIFYSINHDQSITITQINRNETNKTKQNKTKQNEQQNQLKYPADVSVFLWVSRFAHHAAIRAP